MLDELKRLLDHLSSILDAERQAAIDRRYQLTLDYRTRRSAALHPPGPARMKLPFQLFLRDQTLSDPEKMLVQ